MSALPTPTPQRVSYAEYCRLEAAAETRHYFMNGRIYAMSGGSLNHSRIITNVVAGMHTRLRGKPCEMLESNFRIAFPGRTYSHYTDGMVVCGGPQIDPEDPTRQSLTNPTVIFEVQSPSTSNFDRSTKFDHYRMLDTLNEYVLVYQDRPEVQVFVRQADGSWNLQSHTGLAGEVPLRSIGVALPLADVYDRVAFPPEPFEDPPSPDGR